MSTKEIEQLGLKMNEEETNTLASVTGVGSLDNADAAVSTNAIIQVSGVMALIVIYLIFRRRAPWVYYPNIKNKPLHPCYEENPGLLSWIYRLIVVKDTDLLSMVGLDGFMLLQTIKLLYRICLIISIMSSPILVYTLFLANNDQNRSQLFTRLTIWGIQDFNLYWGILGISYLSSMFIFYAIFIYYKRYVTLRQLYLASPATMTSIPHMKKIAKELGSNQNSVDYVNVAGRSVFIDRLPAEISNDDNLMEYLNSLEIGEIESVSLVHDTYYLQKLYEKRNSVIQDIEKEITAAFCRMKEDFASQDPAVKESFGDLSSKDLQKSAETLFGTMRIPLNERVKLLNKFMRNGDRFLSKTWMQKAVLGIHLENLRNVNNEILEEKRKIESSANSDEKIDIPTARENLYADSYIRHDVSFFSLKQIFNIKENKDFFTVDLPMRRKKAFVTFKDQRTCGIAKQTRLGSKAFSSNIESAPAPYDVLWRNVTKPEIGNFFVEILSIGLFVLLNLAFLYVVVTIIESLQIEKGSQNYIFKLLFGANENKVLGIYQGMLAPLIYNILLYFVPISIKALIHMESTNSFTSVQSKLMYRFSLFLFFNGFFATFVASLLLSLLSQSKNKDLGVNLLISELGISIIQSSVFFLNTIVQRMCIGSAMVFLKPSAFLYNFLIAPIAIRTRRQEHEREFSPPIDFGNHIPNLLLIMPMALTYSCICPVVVIAAFLFYWFSYLVYKNELVLATRNDYESGGTYWKPSVRFIMFSLIVFQASTAAITFSSGNTFISIFFLPLIFISSVCANGMDSIFAKSSENFPMNAPEEKFLDYFSKKVLEERYKLLNDWKELNEEFDHDVVPINELGFEDRKAKITESFYKDPSTLDSISNIILPRHFFITIHFVLCFDKNNLFRLQK